MQKVICRNTGFKWVLAPAEEARLRTEAAWAARERRKAAQRAARRKRKC